MQTARLSGACSAWEIRSAATQAAFAVPSASTTISLGPAGMSIFTIPYTSSFAAVTYRLPGPKILSTRGTLSVP